jgi:hypothetical protein
VAQLRPLSHVAHGMRHRVAMSTLEEALEQVISRKSNNPFNSSIAKSEFNRLGALHFSSEILPELRRFESELKPQGVSVNLVWATEPELSAAFVIEYPESTQNLLSINYNFSTRSLILEASIGMNDCETLAKFPLGQFTEIRRVQAYAFIEKFVRDVLSADTLCEFYDDENEPLE